MISARTLHRLAVCCVVGTFVAAGPTLVGQAQDAEYDPVESGRAALRSTGSYPWYDPDKEQVRAVSLKSTEVEVANRDSSWDQSLDWGWKWPDWLRLPNFGAFANFLIYGIVGIVLAVVLYFLILAAIRLRNRQEAPLGELDDEELDPRGDVDRIEALPVPELRVHGNLLDAARRAYETNRYDDAIVFLFSHLLVELDRAQRLRLARGKTNRQYLREVGPRSPLGEILAVAMVPFEDVFFGRHALDRAGFERCWSRLNEFQNLVSQEATP